MDANLAEIAAAAPPIVRVAVGLVGGLLILAGARMYRVGLYGAAFAAGAAIVASGLGWLAIWIPAAGQPMVGLAGALTGGVALAVGARIAHRVAMLAAGALTGLVVGAILVQSLAAPIWVVPVALLMGALSFGWLYEQLLKVLTPAVGAACVAWALGMPGQPLLVGGLWAFGAAVQLAGPRADADQEEEE